MWQRNERKCVAGQLELPVVQASLDLPRLCWNCAAKQGLRPISGGRGQALPLMLI